MPAQETELLREQELLRCPRGDSTVISVRISNRLLELLDERIRELERYGVRTSRAEIIRRLILAFVKAEIRLADENRYDISIGRIEIPSGRYNILGAGVNTTPHHNYTTPPAPPAPPAPPQELIRRVAKALKAVKYLSPEEKEEILSPLVEELRKYKYSSVAQYWLAQIHAELSR